MLNEQRRIAFVVNGCPDEQLKDGRIDSVNVHEILVDPELGACDPNGPPPMPDCPSQEVFWSQLESTLRDSRRQDQLVWYFSGHGKILHDVYCLKVGAVEADYVPFSDIRNRLRIRGVTRAVLILDACAAGNAIHAKDDNGFFLGQELPHGIAIVASCHATQQSREFGDGRGSVFTRLLCEGIRTGLGNLRTSDGYISVSDIVDYTRRKLLEPKYSQYPQTPVHTVNYADRTVWIAKNRSGSLDSIDGIQAERKVRSLDELRLLYEITAHSRRPCDGVRVEDLDDGLVRKYAEKTGRDLTKGTLSLDVLNDLGLLSPILIGQERALHNAAVLCFCQHPEQHPAAGTVPAG